jgi:hypothetical protein
MGSVFERAQPDSDELQLWADLGELTNGTVPAVSPCCAAIEAFQLLLREMMRGPPTDIES